MYVKEKNFKTGDLNFQKLVLFLSKKKYQTRLRHVQSSFSKIHAVTLTIWYQFLYWKLKVEISFYILDNYN